MSIKGYIEKMYRGALFTRRGEDPAVKLFSYDEFEGLHMEKCDMEYENGKLSGQFYYYEGYDTREIAALTEVSEGTVRSRLSRARASLRMLLQEKEAAR